MHVHLSICFMYIMEVNNNQKTKIEYILIKTNTYHKKCFVKFSYKNKFG